jgi:hypothetical protein
MSNDLQYVQEQGRKSEGLSPGTDPITNGAETFYQFGQYNRSWGKFPELESEIVKSLTGAGYDPQSFNVGKTTVMGNVASVVTDGLGLYYATCKQETSGGLEDGGVVDDGSNVYTLTPINNPLDIQSYTTRFHRKNTDTADIQKSIPYCRTQQYTMSLDNSTGNKLPLAQTESFLGQKVQAVAADTDDYVLQLADSLSTLFYWSNDANSLFTWDYGTGSEDNVELRATLRSMAFTINTGVLPIWVSGQHFYNYIPSGARVMVLTAEFEARNETSIFDDYMSQAGTNAVAADLFKAARFKISNANSKYIQLDFGDLGINNLGMNHAFREGDQIPTYQLKAEVRTLGAEIKDGITTLSHYGISV